MARRLLVTLVAGLVLFLSATAASAYSTSPWLDEIATWLAQKPAKVHCLTEEESQADMTISFWGASAYVEGWKDDKGLWHPLLGKRRHTVFAYGICETLLDFRAGDLTGRTVDDLAWAILVITHESGHMRGHRWSADEALTQCWAMRHFKPVAARVGVSDPGLRDFLYWFIYQQHLQMPDAYHGTCSVPKP